jgi:hypothetical protein
LICFQYALPVPQAALWIGVAGDAAHSAARNRRTAQSRPWHPATGIAKTPCVTHSGPDMSFAVRGVTDTGLKQNRAGRHRKGDKLRARDSCSAVLEQRQIDLKLGQQPCRTTLMIGGEHTNGQF